MKKLIVFSAALALTACNLNYSSCHDCDEVKAHHMQKMSDKMFAEVDSDKDGKVSVQEWEKTTKTKFTEIDANKDSNLSKEEMNNFHEKMFHKHH